MDDRLSEMLKDEMGYIDLFEDTCINCNHHKHMNNISTCKLNPAYTFRVSPTGHCKFYKDKQIN